MSALSGSPAPVLLGPASLDCYVDEHLVLPGGGALNMAWHLASAGDPVHLLTRIGADRSTLFTDFLDRHHITASPDLVGDGPSSSIDIRIGDDRQPWMDNFVEGVWREFRLTAVEERTLASSTQLHVVLVAPVVAELDRLAADGLLSGLTVSGDFLSFRRWQIDRFARTMAHLDLGVVGWPGAPDDPLLDEMRDVAHALGTLVVVTLGAQGVRVFDGRDDPIEAFVPVDAVAVAGTTVGCGDAFVAAFLREWWRDGWIGTAVAAGAQAGAAATAWLRPLPDEAY